MTLRFPKTFVVFCLLAGLCIAQQAGYQPGKIVSVQKQEVASPKGGTDAATKASAYAYHVTIETQGKSYMVAYKAHSDLDPTWKEGKDVQVGVQGKTMYVRRDGGEPLKLHIVK